MLDCLTTAPQKSGGHCASSPVRGLALQICSFVNNSQLVMSEYYCRYMNSFISVRVNHKSSPPSLGLSDVPGAGDTLSASPRNLVISGCSVLFGLSAWSLPSKIIDNIYGQCGTDHLQEQRLIQNRTDRLTVGAHQELRLLISTVVPST